jgi:hypothetical protein
MDFAMLLHSTPASAYYSASLCFFFELRLPLFCFPFNNTVVDSKSMKTVYFPSAYAPVPEREQLFFLFFEQKDATFWHHLFFSLSPPQISTLLRP